jgi:hypothetical protein
MSKLNKNILNEINRYREIVGLPIIDEQRKKNKGQLTGVEGRSGKQIEPLSWNGGNEGKVNLDNTIVTRGTSAIAVNLGSMGLNLYYGSFQPTIQPKSEVTPAVVKDIIMPSFRLEGATMGYDNNQINPNWGKFPEAKNKFDEIVDKFVAYINAGGFEKISSITIKGSADANTPTTNNADHDYGGLEDTSSNKMKMNQFLADNRAKVYKNLLIKEVKAKTGKTLDITELTGDNFYGKTPKGDYVGQQYRSITLDVKAEVLKVPDKKEVTPGSSKFTPVDRSQQSAILKIIKPDGTTIEREGINFITQSGSHSENKVHGFHVDDNESISEVIHLPSKIVNGEIVGNVLKLDGKDVCTFYSVSEPNSPRPEYKCKVTAHRNEVRDNILLLRHYSFRLVKPR